MLAKRAKQIAVLLMVTNPLLLRSLNQYHLKLSDSEREKFHTLYAKMFRRRLCQRLMRYHSQQWTVRFMSHYIAMPLRRDSIWLDWDSAVSITGHDIEVKRTYSKLLSSDKPPELFFDVGANYGTHSALFRSAGVPVVAFEPNPSCFAFCKSVCQLNRFSLPQWEQVAIGDRLGNVNLTYPERETWLGSVSPGVVQTISERREVVSKTVPIRPLDDYFSQVAGKRLLIKIDVEGFELEVLRGASRILADVRPDIIFESNDPSFRSQLFELLASRNYGIHALPKGGEPQPLVLELFVRSQSTNFLAKSM